MNITKLISIGGVEWKKSDTLHRIYFDKNRIAEILGLDCQYYNTGNISSAALCGESISNSRAKSIWSKMPDKFWYDVPTGKFNWSLCGDNFASEIIAAITNKINQ